jgi:hypothetical protein
MNPPPSQNRRRFIQEISLGGVTLGLTGCQTFSQNAKRVEEPKAVAGILTWYIKGSHADVLIGKILEGWAYDGGPGPNLRLASLYVDQFPDGDMARAMAEKHGVKIYSTIEDAITLGTDRVAVDGILSIGEHGDYPWNEKEQHLYPRRRFFDAIAATLEKHDKVVPVFNDKHLGPEWDDALWMYHRAQSLNIPFMAGSSLPVSYRNPDVGIPMGSHIEAALGVGYSGLDIYGIHTLEVFQSFTERRHGGETGVKSVQWFGAKDMWALFDDGTLSASVLEAALKVTPKSNIEQDPRKLEGDGVGLFMFEYEDGLLGAVMMLPGYLQGCGIAVQIKGHERPIATMAEERKEPHYPHFAYLLKGIETMIHTGVPAYPVERTLLTSGILDRALTSRFEGGKKLLTPELKIDYRAVDYPNAPRPSLTSPYRQPAGSSTKPVGVSISPQRH